MIYLDDHNHLFSNNSLYKLYEFAMKLGLKPEWNHYSRGFPHFDLMKSKISKAIKTGATLIKAKDPVWRESLDQMRQHFFNRQWHIFVVQADWYEDVGLMNQKILRLKIQEVAQRDLKYQESRINEQHSLLGN